MNYTFVVIFTIEAILKITAQGCYYFQDSWNLFDFMIVVLTIVILSLNFVGVGEKLEILGTVLRTLRIGRVFRLIKKQKKLNAIFITLIKVFVFDMARVSTPMRILSFFVTGMLLIGASFLYHRFKDRIVLTIGGEKDESDE